jgi:hypothetical protein
MMHTFLNWPVAPCPYTNLYCAYQSVLISGLIWGLCRVWGRVSEIESDIYEEVPADETA